MTRSDNAGIGGKTCAGLLALALGFGAPQASASPGDGLHDVVQATGVSCLTGGAMAGALVLLGAGGALGSYAAAAVGSPAPLTGIGTTLVGCGGAAAATLGYYTGLWSYETFVSPPERQLVYPPLPARP
jgi:hypothetical protein